MRRRTFIGMVTAGGALAAIPLALRRGAQPAPGRPPGEPGRRVVDRDGHVYDVHPAAGRIDFLGAGAAPHASAEVVNPMSLAVDGAGRVLVLTQGAGLLAFDRQGHANGDATPAWLAADRFGGSDVVARDGRLAIAAAMRHRVVVTDGGGAAPVTITDLDAPVSVALGADGRIHVADRGTCTVAVYAADGAPLARLGGYGRADGQLVAPRCVRLDGDGNVHVADLAAACVHVFDARHRFVARHQPTLADGRPAVALWLSDHPDGTVVPTLAARPG